MSVSNLYSPLKPKYFILSGFKNYDGMHRNTIYCFDQCFPESYRFQEVAYRAPSFLQIAPYDVCFIAFSLLVSIAKCMIVIG